MRINAYLAVAETPSGLVVRCQCGHTIGPASRPYKELALESRREVGSLGPNFDPDGLGRGHFEVREYFCPGCAVLLEVEVARPEEPLLVDVELDLAQVAP